MLQPEEGLGAMVWGMSGDPRTCGQGPSERLEVGPESGVLGLAGAGTDVGLSKEEGLRWGNLMGY